LLLVGMLRRKSALVACSCAIHRPFYSVLFLFAIPVTSTDFCIILHLTLLSPSSLLHPCSADLLLKSASASPKAQAEALAKADKVHLFVKTLRTALHNTFR
jgi:hypothetical protein